jgi:hypothetical protein
MLSTPEQCESWSDLLTLMTWQLWLARDIVSDNTLPWQKPQAKLTLLLGSSGCGRSFRGDWYTCCCTQTRVETPLSGL